jgi:hypothetical protein
MVKKTAKAVATWGGLMRSEALQDECVRGTKMYETDLNIWCILVLCFYTSIVFLNQDLNRFILVLCFFLCICVCFVFDIICIHVLYNIYI